MGDAEFLKRLGDDASWKKLFVMSGGMLVTGRDVVAVLEIPIRQSFRHVLARPTLR